MQMIQLKPYVHFHTDPTDFSFFFLECGTPLPYKHKDLLAMHMNQAVYTPTPKQGIQHKIITHLARDLTTFNF